MHRRLSLVIAPLLALFVFSPVAASPLAVAQCFPAVPGISNCIDGRFNQFWSNNGGLPVFGYPITSQRDEVNADLQKPFSTQWFERNRYEQHPENAVPYDVLLGRLGAELLQAQDRDWHNEPNNGNPLGGACRHFNDTDRDVCGPFLQYWLGHGLQDPKLDAYGKSLALFGLPLTGVKSEKNPNGDTVMTQWFERARFELHPEAGNIVLLGLLGNERRGSIPVPPQDTSPTEVRTFAPFDITGNINPAFHVVSSETGSCWEGSIATNRADAWRCTAQSAIYDPCFQQQTSQPSVVLCVMNVWTGEMAMLNLTEPLPKDHANTISPPYGSIWALSLTTGEHCDFATGATDAVDGYRANYFCGPSGPDGYIAVYGDVDQSSPQWKVRVWRKGPQRPLTIDALDVVTVSVAWR